MKQVTDKLGSEPEFSSIFRELLGQLLIEPFALKNSFENFTLEDIGLMLEEPLGDDPHLVEDFDDCKSTYCLLLLELEILGYSDLPIILKQQPLKALEHLAIKPADSRGSNVDTIPKIAEISSEENTTRTFKAATLLESYLNIAESFSSKKIDAVLSVTNEARDRATIQFLIASCEIAVFERLKTDLIQLWPSRQERILELIEDNAFNFKDEISQVLQVHERRYPQWLFDDRFPKLGALHCLRYLTLTKSVESLHPSVFELGSFIYFWGALKETPSKGTEAYINLSGLNKEQQIEVAFRLFRLDRIKASALNFNRELPSHLLQMAQEDTQQILEILNGAQMKPDERDVA